jgi:hypothetical protein
LSASPTWLEGLARGAARRDLHRAEERVRAPWGSWRFTRRRAVAGAASATAAAGLLRFVPAAAAAPACQNPCLQDAARDLAKSNKFANKFFGGEVDRLAGKVSQLQSKLSHTTGSKARGKIQRQIQNLQNRELQTLGAWQDSQSGNYDAFMDDAKDCRSNSNCGNPQKYPDNYTPPSTPPPSGNQSCADPATACGELCCTSGSRCCGACKTCCIVEVTCSDCCPK